MPEIRCSQKERGNKKNNSAMTNKDHGAPGGMRRDFPQAGSMRRLDVLILRCARGEPNSKSISLAMAPAGPATINTGVLGQKHVYALRSRRAITRGREMAVARLARIRIGVVQLGTQRRSRFRRYRRNRRFMEWVIGPREPGFGARGGLGIRKSARGINGADRRLGMGKHAKQAPAPVEPGIDGLSKARTRKPPFLGQRYERPGNFSICPYNNCGRGG